MNRMNVLGIGFILGICVFLGIAMSKQSANAVEIYQSDAFEVAQMKEEPKEIIVEVVQKEHKADHSVIHKTFDDIPLTEVEQIALWDKCHELDVNYWFVLALLESESDYRFVTGDSGNSVGYMQINKCNWERMKTQYGLDVNEPVDNLLCGATIFWELANKYDTITQVVMSYKCGESRAKQLLEQGVVLSCVDEIAQRAMELENMHS